MNRIRMPGTALSLRQRPPLRRRPIAPRLAARAAEFARRIVARFARGAGSWGRASLHLRRSAHGPRSVLHRHDHRWRLARLAPRIDVRLEGAGGAPPIARRSGAQDARAAIPGSPRGFVAAGSPARERAAPGAPRPVIAPGIGSNATVRGTDGPNLELPVRPTLRRRAAVAAGRDEAERALDAPIGVVRTIPPARARRIEEPSWASSRGVVRRVLRVASAAPPTGGDDRSPPRRGWPETAPAAPSRQVSSATAPRAAQLDVQRVTDQVMRQIDRRLVAWRERTGRV